MAKRTAMGILRNRHGFSQRRTCRLVGLHRSTADYSPIHKDEAELRDRLESLAAENKRYGDLRLHALLRREGLVINAERTYRLYTQAGLQVRTKKRRKLPRRDRVSAVTPTRPLQRLSGLLTAIISYRDRGSRKASPYPDPQETGPAGPEGEDNLLDEAARANPSARETLALLCEREIARKDHRRIDMALKFAHFPAVKDLASFDYEAQSSVDPKQVRDLATGRWIANGENLLLLGPPGVGKTHLAIALGREAILAGCAVQFVTATTLVAYLAKGSLLGVA